MKCAFEFHSSRRVFEMFVASVNIKFDFEFYNTQKRSKIGLQRKETEKCEKVSLISFE